jgi:hypothetical protein
MLLDRGGLRWGVEQRLAFIESRLFWDGGVNRSDIVAAFDVSVPQASKDLALYQDQAPRNLRYDGARKRYVSAEAFAPRFIKPDADAYLRELLGRGFEDGGAAGPGGLVAERLPLPQRRIDPGVLRLIVAATREERSLEVLYQSSDLDQPGPQWRRISPHAFAHDGARWHVRAFCHRDGRFRDFVASRCPQARAPGPPGQRRDRDEAWNTHFPVALVTNPRLPAGLAAIVAEDFGMEGGEVTIPVRVALLYAFSKRLRLDLADDAVDPREAPVVVRNRAEFDAALARRDFRPHPTVRTQP